MKTKSKVKAVRADGEKAEVIRNKFSEIRAILRPLAIEQDDAVEVLTLATLTENNLLFVGPYGCNKTRLVDMYLQLIGGNERKRTGKEEDSYTFSTNLNKYSPPSELIGPIDIGKLTKENSEWKHNLKDGIADCDYAFIDELYRANGATLSALVRILNEKEVHDGVDRVKCRVRSIIAATNDEPLPHLDAVHDRFLFRHFVGYIDGGDHDSFISMMQSPDVEIESLKPVLNLKALSWARHAVGKVTISDSIYDELYELRGKLLGDHKISLSNRRWNKAKVALQAAAFLRGNDDVDTSDFWNVFRFILWFKIPERGDVYRSIEQYKDKTLAATNQDKLNDAKRVFQDAMKSGDDSEMDAIMALTEFQNDVTDASITKAIAKMIDQLESKMLPTGV